MKENIKTSGLRKKAEDILKTIGNDGDKMQDVRTLIYELQVYQIELELQNEELRRAQNELEESCNKYTDLYDFAPIGYFTFDVQGIITDLNLAGANLLGAERMFLKKLPLLSFIAPE